jgi:ectoine hydroxylase-related dioxygenase (phytanoyl-CoA dioxygenase family)
MANLMLSEDQKREFDDNGFLVIEDALTAAEVERYTAVVDRLDREQPTTHGGKPRKAGEPLELRNSVAVARDLMPLLDHPSAFPAVVDLMGDNLCMTTSHVFLRPPTPGAAADFKAIGWHKDGPPGDTTPPMNGRWPWLYTKIGYFLTDLTIPDAGALRVVPGSHKMLRPAWKPGEPEPYGFIELRCKPGTAVIFENRLWHAVGPNYSAVPRKNVYVGYCWRWMRPIDYVRQSDDLLAAATPVQRQLLGDVKSSLGYILPTDADLPLRTWRNERLKTAAVVTASPARDAVPAAPAMI